MSRCKCTSGKPPSQYPGRLISLKQLKTQDFLDTRRLISTGQRHFLTDQVRVNLVETEDWKDGLPEEGNVRYVTLSHCWGTKGNDQLTLNSGNIEELKNGIELRMLPQTFRDAVEFASRLPQVGYIWIDSLCIKQGPNERTDWLIQSACMDKVYRESFLNISATASNSSDEGLFYSRHPELLLEDEVVLNIEGLPGSKKEDGLAKTTEIASAPITRSGFRFRWLQRFAFVAYLVKLLRLFRTFTASFLRLTSKSLPKLQSRIAHDTARRGSLITTRDHSPSGRSEVSEISEDIDHKNLKRCTILDASFWTNYIDNAPVNKRGWVLQERLMAPRVLHFCSNQVAWECAEFDAAEGHPQGMPNFQLTLDGIVEESRLKGLDVRRDGRRRRRIRLKGYDDPDAHLKPEIYALELWKRIVEVYSRTAISKYP